MRPHEPLARRFAPDFDQDPREHQGAEVIDLATRNVLPQVAAKKGRSDALGLAAGVGLVALLGAVTLWSLDSSRKEQAALAPAAPVQQAPAVPVQAITPVPQTSPAPAPAVAPSAPAPQSVLAAQPQIQAGTLPAAYPLSSATVVFDASALPLPGPGLADPGAPALRRHVG